MPSIRAIGSGGEGWWGREWKGKRDGKGEGDDEDGVVCIGMGRVHVCVCGVTEVCMCGVTEVCVCGVTEVCVV